MPTPAGDFRLQYLEINNAELEEDMHQHAAEFGWIGTLYEAVKTKAASKKLDVEEAEAGLKTIEASIYLRIQQEDAGLGARDTARRTVDAIKATVAADQQVVNARLALFSLKRELLELDHGQRQIGRIVSSLSEKGKMIQSAVGLRRSQIDLELQDSRAERSARQTKEKDA
jgi:hypothetical protein